MQDKAREEKLDDCKLCGKEGDHVLDIWEENWSDDMIQYVGQILQAPNARYDPTTLQQPLPQAEARESGSVPMLSMGNATVGKHRWKHTTIDEAPNATRVRHFGCIFAYLRQQEYDNDNAELEFGKEALNCRARIRKESKEETVRSAVMPMLCAGLPFEEFDVNRLLMMAFNLMTTTPEERERRAALRKQRQRRKKTDGKRKRREEKEKAEKSQASSSKEKGRDDKPQASSGEHPLDDKPNSKHAGNNRSATRPAEKPNSKRKLRFFIASGPEPMGTPHPAKDKVGKWKDLKESYRYVKSMCTTGQFTHIASRKESGERSGRNMRETGRL